MDESTFKSTMFYAEVMRSTENRPDYWAGYRRGLRRAYHGDRFGTEEEHILWSSLADSDDRQRSECGLGYLDGLAAG
jgi:hypothetical protein